MGVTSFFPLLLIVAFYYYSVLLIIVFPGTVEGAGDGVPAPQLGDEVLGLIAFKSSLSDPTGALASWSVSDPTPCAWAHVGCDPGPAPRVRRLSLSSLSLAGGPLPAVLSLLPYLRRLSLAGNSILGRLPNDASLLPNLVSLDLSGNRLSGQLPDALFSPAGTGANLRHLDLSGNRFSGPIPTSLRHCAFLLHLNLSGNRFSGSPDFSAGGLWSLTRLRVLDLSNNSFTGPVPDGVANLHNLKVLNLGGNRFEGNIPASVGLCPHLSTLDLSRNAFDGAVPDALRYLRFVAFVSSSDNRLSGEVPTWLGNWTSVEHLDLSGNRFTGGLPASLGELTGVNYLSLAGNMLAGEIPGSVGECTELRELQLQGNGLSGSIPPALFDLGLQVLDLSSNELTGTLPPGSARAAETLRYLDLSRNKLTGTIPEEWALYFGLRHLNLSWNELQTQLPPELGFFRNLSVLDLRSNALYGPIPGDLCDSGSLSVLQLDGNSLSGTIPEEIGNCSSLHLLSLSHNSLSGPIPAAVARLKNLQILNLEFNGLSGEIPPQLGELDNLLVMNVSHNRLTGRLPAGGVFQSLDGSALEGNLGLCSPLVNEPCEMNVPKPLVLDPNAYNAGNGAGNLVDVNPAGVPSSSRHRTFLSVSSMVAISAAVVIVLGVLVITALNASARRRIGLLETALESMCSGSSRSSGAGSPAVGKVVLFSPRSSDLRPEDLAGGEESLLSKATEIGRGAFGTVYKAPLRDGRAAVAVKKLPTADILPYHDDFDREVRVLAKARHPNLVPLRGYYWTPQLQLLLSDYAAGGSLEERLHVSRPALTWAERFKIALGTAEGLAYLHQSFRPPIIHYGVKPGNILLDEGGNARISDFGLARLVPKLESRHVVGSRFRGAMGYVAPELACQSLRINEKCDVYSFGVVVVELVTGRRAVECGEEEVVVAVERARALLEQGDALGCVDPAMGGAFPEGEVLPVLKLGLVCTSQIPSSRPSMAEVVQILQVIKTPVVHRMEPEPEPQPSFLN